MEADIDPSLDGIEGQGQRSKVKVKRENNVSASLVSEKWVKVKVTGQRSKFFGEFCTPSTSGCDKLAFSSNIIKGKCYNRNNFLFTARSSQKSVLGCHKASA